VAAARGLPGGYFERIRYLVQAATIALAVPYPRSAVQEVRRALGLDRARAFSLTQHACASALLAVDVCGRLLATDGDPDALALIVTGEKTFTPVAQLIPDSAVMSEGTAAVLVRPGAGRDTMLGYASRCHGEFFRAPFQSSAVTSKFNAAYTPALAEVIMTALSRARLAADQIDLVLPHNVNRMSWLRAARATGLPADRIVLDTVPTVGHCFGADSFINYRLACERGLLRPGDHYLMTAVGLNATFSAMVFRH
jgi:3-oxoacyl-[acyl-carrier-protein] synthase-3